MIEIGYFSFCFALLLAVYSAFTGAFCIFRPYATLFQSSRNALVGVFLCLFLSSLILWNAIFFHDFSVSYVYRHTAVNMPPIYLFTSFWSALEGSHLLWTLLMSAVCAVSICTIRKKNETYGPTLSLVYGVSLSFMLILNVTISAPLKRMFPSGLFGLGMNALLQNAYMAIHPPMLFTGYSLLIVPFAYSAAALVKGYFTPEIFITIRRTSLIAWVFLTTAIFLGGRWAYFELGWGGYWGWDPVENSSFMPWLALTAAIHTFLIYTRTKRLPRLGLFLFMTAFTLSFQGTFITRSGIISSVHSFAESDIGPAYLAWILFLLSSTLLLIFLRGYLLEGAAKINEWRVSKETSLLFTIFFLLFLLAIVFIGTILPLVVEAIKGVKISIQQPFFNAFLPWIGMGFVSILGVGNLMKWKTGKIDDPISCLLYPAFWSLCLTLALTYQKGLNVKVSIAYFMVFWTAFVLIMDLLYKLKSLHWKTGAFLKYQRAYLGALIIHLGFLMAILGFTGNLQMSSAEVNLNLHQSTTFHGYKITNNGLTYSSEYNVQTVGGVLNATNLDTKETVLISPMRRKFTNNEQWFNEIGVYSTFWHDIYLVLSSFDVKTESVSLKMNYNPTVKFVWTSLVTFIIGALIALSHKSVKNKNPWEDGGQPHFEDKPIKSSDPKKIGQNLHQEISMNFSSLILVIFTFLCLVFAYSGVAFAQQSPIVEQSQLLTQGSGNGTQLSGKQNAVGDQIPMEMNSKIIDVAKELRCPTCLGISIIESGTPQSQAMREEIAKELQAGKTKKEIIEYFKSRYGSWILREPDIHSSYGFWIWFLCLGGLVAGPLFILVGVKTSQKRYHNRKNFLISEIKSYIQQAKEREKL